MIVSIEAAIKVGLKTIESALAEVEASTSLKAARDTPTSIGIERGVDEETVESMPAALEAETTLSQDKGKGWTY